MQLKRGSTITNFLPAILLSLQPKQRQHFIDKSSHLSQLIVRRKAQHRRRNAHVEPLLNQPGAISRRSMGKPDLDQALGRIGRAVIVIEVVFRFCIRNLFVVVDIDHAVNSTFKIR